MCKAIIFVNLSIICLSGSESKTAMAVQYPARTLCLSSDLKTFGFCQDVKTAASATQTLVDGGKKSSINFLFSFCV